MGYKVIQFFTDLQDFDHPYNIGDTFPRVGMNVSDSRIHELSTECNKQGKPLIALDGPDAEKEVVIDPVKVEQSQLELYTRRDIERMKVSDLKIAASKVGISCEGKSGTTLKKELMKFYNM